MVPHVKGSAHHDGAHPRLARAFVAWATRQPGAHCIVCGWPVARPLRPHSTGRPGRWIAGHKRAGVVATSLDDYQLECSHCSTREGAKRAADTNRPNRVTRVW